MFAVDALSEIASQLGKKDWNFSLNPCDGNSNWSTPIITEKPLYGNNVSCNCSYPNGECHVVNMYVSFSYYHYKLLYISISWTYIWCFSSQRLNIIPFQYDMVDKSCMISTGNCLYFFHCLHDVSLAIRPKFKLLTFNATFWFHRDSLLVCISHLSFHKAQNGNRKQLIWHNNIKEPTKTINWFLSNVRLHFNMFPL